MKILKHIHKIIILGTILALINIFPTLALAKDFTIGAQSATYEEAMIVINKMKEEGGNFQEINGKYGSKYFILKFKNIPNTKLIYQLTGMGMENATLHSVLLAEGLDTNIIPDVVINSGTCGNMHSDEIGNIYLPKYFVISNFGKLSKDNSFENWPVRIWNPNQKQYEIKSFFVTNKDLLSIGEKTFNSFKTTKEYKNLSNLLKQNIKFYNSGIGLSDNELNLSIDKKNIQRKYFINLLYTQLYEKSQVHVTDMETAAVAKVFYEKNIPFVGIRVPSDATSGMKNEEWSKLAKKILGVFNWQFILDIAKSNNLSANSYTN